MFNLVESRFVYIYIFFYFILAGVIDEDYRGNVGIILFNHSNEDFVVNPGDRVAQLICEKIEYPELVEREVISSLLKNHTTLTKNLKKKLSIAIHF